jgi:hypothetical protein
MSENQSKKTHVEIEGASLHVTGDQGETVDIGPGGIYVKDGEDEVKVSWTGVRIRDGKTRVQISLIKPLIGCTLGLIVFAAALTAVVVTVINLMK